MLLCSKLKMARNDSSRFMAPCVARSDKWTKVRSSIALYTGGTQHHCQRIGQLASDDNEDNRRLYDSMSMLHTGPRLCTAMRQAEPSVRAQSAIHLHDSFSMVISIEEPSQYRRVEASLECKSATRRCCQSNCRHLDTV